MKDIGCGYRTWKSEMLKPKEEIEVIKQRLKRAKEIAEGK